MDINVKSKFDIEQKVYCIESYREHPTCKVCEGSGLANIINSRGTHEIECPNCNGTGKSYGEYELILWKMKCGELTWEIDGLNMWLWKHEKDVTSFSYSVTYAYPQGGFCSTTIDETNCFTTLKEALEEIEKRNANPKYDWDDE